MAEPEECECVVCYNDTVADHTAPLPEGTLRRSSLCARCCVCENCVDDWVKKRCLTGSIDTDIRCPCCMNTVETNLWLRALSDKTIAFLDQQFRDKFQVVCDEGCQHEFRCVRVVFLRD
jgi:hypothetical protein